MFRNKNITFRAYAVNHVNKSAAGERNDAKLMVPLEAPSENLLSMIQGHSFLCRDEMIKKNPGCCNAPCI